MPFVTIDHGKEQTRVEVPAGATLLEAIHKSGFRVPVPCGGRGRCGKCIAVAAGALDDPRPEEAAFLDGYPAGTRLACRAVVLGDCHAALPKASEAVVETAYTAWEGTLDPIYPDGYGAAFDIGTTTVAGQLFARDSKMPLAVLGELNAQAPYGADVLSRTVYCNDHTVAPLRDIIRGQIIAMLSQMCRNTGVPPAEVKHLVVTGNSIMLCIFAGIEPRPLGVAPFSMPTFFGVGLDVALAGFKNAAVYAPHSTSAYIGGDITCSVLASGMTRLPGKTLLIDAGTNGELVLAGGGRLVCCSTAAGPAFEGVGIQCGGNAAPGAIDSVTLEDGETKYTTIGGGPAEKICGSGLIDAVAVMLERAALDENGRLDKAYGGAFPLEGERVFITQKDIRQVQLAKSAIRAGIDTLLHACGLTAEALDAVILCGGFGSYLRPQSAERIGMLPPGAAEKTIAIGNAAGNGAGQILQSRAKLAESGRIFDDMETVELATSPVFMERFTEAIYFP